MAFNVVVSPIEIVLLPLILILETFIVLTTTVTLMLFSTFPILHLMVALPGFIPFKVPLSVIVTTFVLLLFQVILLFVTLLGIIV